MDRRGFLSVSAAVGAGGALASVNSLWQVPSPQGEVSKQAGASLVPEVVNAYDLGGGLQFALSRFAADATLISGAGSAVDSSKGATLSPLHDVVFRGFAGGPGLLANDQLRVVAVHETADGYVARHDLWSYSPALAGGGASSPALFTAHDLAFSGFEVTHITAAGMRKSAMFGFRASGNGPALLPGVYVLAGPRAATGAPPELARYGYSGDVAAPVRESRLLGLDFPYLTFVVHSELI